jgi:hypothetical protein
MNVRSRATSKDKRGGGSLLPRWMRASHVTVGTFDDLLREGVGVLVRAAEGGGAHRRKVPILLPDRRRLHLSFQERICRLIDRYGLGGSGSSILKQPASQIAHALVAKMRIEGGGVLALSDGVTPARLKLLVAELSNAWSRGRRRVDADWQTPFSTLADAYLAAYRQDMGTDKNDPWCLVALALACRGIKDMRRCELCFRWAVPGMRFCGEHTQSSVGRGDPRARGARYRRAKRMLTSFESSIRRMKLPAVVSAVRLPRIVGRVLWDIGSVDDEAAVDASVSKLAAGSRLNQALLRDDEVSQPWPEELRYFVDVSERRRDSAKRYRAHLWGALRASLDPFEWDPTNWPVKIEAADRWFGCSAQRFGLRGQGKSTAAKLAHAIFLADAGYSRRDVAKAVGISISALSNWTARFAVRGHPFERLISRLNSALPSPSELRRRNRKVRALVKARTRTTK